MKHTSQRNLSLRKALLSALVVAPLATLPAPVWAALPNITSTNLSSSAGAATTFVTVGATNLSITTPDRSVLTWGNYGVDFGDTHNFILPSATSSVLNRVTGGATTVAGVLNSNGRVIILNTAGITVAGTAVVGTAGLALSTISEPDFTFSSTGALSYVGTATSAVTVVNGAAITVGSTGNVTLAGNTVDFAGTINAGTLDVRATATAGTGVAAGGAALTRVGGDSSLSTGRYGTLNITTSGSAVDLTAAGADVAVSGGVLNVTTSGGNVIQGGAGTLVVGTTQAAGSLSINTSGTTPGAVTIGAVTGNGKDLNVTLNSGAATITNPSANNLVVQASTVNGNLSLASTLGSITSGGKTTMVGANRTVTLAAATAGKVIVFDGIGNLTFPAIVSDNVNAASAVTLTSSGTLATAGVTSSLVTLTAAGNITQTGPITSSATATFDSTAGSVTLGDVTNGLNNVVLKNAPTGVTLNEATALTVANGTNVTGAATITTAAGGIALGAASGNTIVFGSTLGLTAVGGDITDGSDNITVIGALTVSAPNVILDGGNTGASRFTALKSQYGPVKGSSAGNVTIWENTTLNLGALTVGGDLQAYSSTGIINTGRLQVTGTTTVGAGTAAAPGDIDLTFSAAVGSGNTFTGAIGLLDDLTTIIGGVSIGNYLAGNISVRGDTSPVLAIPVNIYAQGIAGNVALTTTGATALAPGALRTTGAVTLTSGTGDITANDAGNNFGAITVNSAGGTVIVSSTNASNVTVNAALTGSGAGTASYTATAGTLTIGNYASNYTGATTFTTGANKAIQDSVAGINIFSDVQFTSAGSIDVNRTGHNFGGVGITTVTNKGSATIRESGTLRLKSVSTNDTGNFTATSTSGSIIQTAADNGIVLGNASGTATLTASMGKVTLDDNDAGAAGNRSPGRFNITAGDNIVVEQNVATVLGNVVTPGSLTVDTSVGTNAGITQFASTSLNVFNAVNLNAIGTGVVTINNTGNRMGPVSAQTTSGAITLREDPTLNLRAISTTGNLTATSTDGGIIDTTGTVAAGFTNTIVAGGTSSFTATNGNIALGLANSQFATVAFTTSGNASLIDSNVDLALGASTVAGSLSVTNSSGNISQAGALNIGGDVTILATAAGSSITLPDSNNRFGGVRFTVGTGGATINEVTTFNLRSGSISTGAVTIGTGGDFITSGPGGSSFLGNLSISATGTIIPSTGSMLVVGTFSVSSNATKDLSALSKSGNLTGKDPVNVGTGTYVPPSP